ncbi:hypothetical protein HA466_0155160 [Hirschfeldia incana]|nr:hypothetical protein HA466_0155160 [Hirschfeldia incana]
MSVWRARSRSNGESKLELKGVTATVKEFNFSGFILCFGDVRIVCLIRPPFKLVFIGIELSPCRLCVLLRSRLHMFHPSSVFSWLYLYLSSLLFLVRSLLLCFNLILEGSKSLSALGSGGNVFPAGFACVIWC